MLNADKFPTNCLANDPIIQMCIGTATRTLLFYRDSMMVWSAQLDVVPASMLLGSYG
jgi:hypothetical protein